MIRLASLTDIPALARVNVDTWRATYAHVFSPEFFDALSYEQAEMRFRRILSEPDVRIFVADENGDIGGYAIAGPSRESVPGLEGELFAIYVRPSWHRRGIGSQLWQASVTWIQKLGMRSMLVVVFTENPGARQFYEALGAKPEFEREVSIRGERVREWIYGWHGLPTSADVVKQRAIAQFSRTAEAYVTSASHGNPEALSKLVQVLEPQPHWVFLDIATGGGHVAKTMAPHVRTVVASDLTTAMLAAARDHLAEQGFDNVVYVEADAEQLPFLDGSFDAVACRIAPHHFPHPQLFVQEAARVLKPGGRFLLVDNIVPEEEDIACFYNHLEKIRDPSHVRCPSESEWRDFLGAAGLTVVTAEVSRKVFEFDKWVRRMVEDEAEVARIEHTIREADTHVVEWLDVQLQDGSVRSFSGLEWMALCEKLA